MITLTVLVKNISSTTSKTNLSKMMNSLRKIWMANKKEKKEDCRNNFISDKK